MIHILEKIFIRQENPDKRYACGLVCSVTGIFLNVVLFLIKFIAGAAASSVSLTADAFNNLSDSLSSVITLSGMSLSRKKPDPRHPFGHGRMEYLSGVAVSVLIIIMGTELLSSSVNKIFKPEVPEIGASVFIVLGISVAVKLYMFLYNRKYGKKYSSPALKATAADSLSDALSSAGVFISMLITYFTDFNTDALCGIAVSVFVLYAGIKSSLETVSPLLGQPPEKDFIRKTEEIVLSGKYVIGMHDLIVHDYGPGRCMLSLHAEVPGNEDIFLLHESIDSIERELSEKLCCEAVIHMDPVDTDNEKAAELKKTAEQLVKSINSEFTIHDFRAVKDGSHTNLIFDVAVPASCKTEDYEINREIYGEIQNYNRSFYPIVNIDRNYNEIPDI